MERILTMDSEEKTLLDYTATLDLPSQKEIESRRNQRFKPLAGNEHKVFHDREFPGRVLKFTHPGKFGRKEHTPFLYLDRWRLQELLVPASKPRLEAVFQDDKGKLCMVVSMPWIKGPPPTPQELDQYIKNKGFTPIRDGSTTLDYICPITGLIYRDCHPDNWVKTSRKGEPLALFPIDICLERIPPCSKKS